MPKRIEGLAAFGEMFRGVSSQLFGRFEWTALDLHATDQADLAFGTGSANITMPNGELYTQDYAFVLRERGGKIAEYTEFMDPIRAGDAMARATGTGAHTG